MTWWRDRAACLGMSGDIFFPADRKFTSKTWIAARAVCAECVVREQCLAAALAVDVTQDRWGMFGGMTPSERKYHRRRLAKQA